MIINFRPQFDFFGCRELLTVKGSVEMVWCEILSDVGRQEFCSGDRTSKVIIFVQCRPVGCGDVVMLKSSLVVEDCNSTMLSNM